MYRVTRHPAGMHCPSWDDAFVSSLVSVLFRFYFSFTLDVTAALHAAVEARNPANA